MDSTLTILTVDHSECNDEMIPGKLSENDRLYWEFGLERLEPRRNRINPRVNHKVSNYAKKHPHHRPLPPLRKVFLESVVMLI